MLKKIFPKNKKGQMKISFGMIFSIILIVVFLAFAFYAIQKFVGIGKEIETKQFIDSLKTDIDKMYKSPKGSQEVVYNVPSKITEVCFSDDEYQNLIFKSQEYVKGEMILNIDIEKITQNENPKCFKNNDGKVKFTLSKDYSDKLVNIS